MKRRCCEQEGGRESLAQVSAKNRARTLRQAQGRLWGTRLRAAERRLAELLAVLIEDFEEEAYALKPASPTEVLRELMESNGLKQKDMLEIFGTPSIASEVLNEKRGLTVEHIRKLSRRFHVSPEVFF